MAVNDSIHLYFENLRHVIHRHGWIVPPISGVPSYCMPILKPNSTWPPSVALFWGCRDAMGVEVEENCLLTTLGSQRRGGGHRPRGGSRPERSISWSIWWSSEKRNDLASDSYFEPPARMDLLNSASRASMSSSWKVSFCVRISAPQNSLSCYTRTVFPCTRGLPAFPLVLTGAEQTKNTWKL